MSNVATVSFKIAPDRYAVLKAMAAGEGLSVSEFVRRTVEGALDLERQVERLAAVFAGHGGAADFTS